jgi:hypothetical protein
LAGYAVTFQDIRGFPDKFFKSLVVEAGMPIQLYQAIAGKAPFKFFRIKNRGKRGKITLILQFQKPGTDRGERKIYHPAQFGQRYTRILLKSRYDFSIKIIHKNYTIISKQCRFINVFLREFRMRKNLRKMRLFQN